MKRKKLKSLKSLRNKLDIVFASYIRLRDEGKPCITCGKRVPLQCGHFIKRQHLATRWDVFNAHGQCARCNMWLHGNEGAYCMALVKLYGEDTVEGILGNKHKTVKFTRADLEAMIERFSASPLP